MCFNVGWNVVRMGTSVKLVVVVVDEVGCGGSFRQQLEIFLLKLIKHVPLVDRADLFQNKTAMIVWLVF